MTSKHYTTNKTERSFTIDDDRFFIKPAVPAGKMFELLKFKDAFTEGDDMDPDELLQSVTKILDLVMMKKSTDLFAKRMFDDDNPIDFPTFLQVIEDISSDIVGKEDEEPSSS